MGVYLKGQRYGENVGHGIIPTGTKSITENGPVDVTQYATADVNVPPDIYSKLLQNARSFNSGLLNPSGYSSYRIPDFETDELYIKLNNPYSLINMFKMQLGAISQKFPFKKVTFEYDNKTASITSLFELTPWAGYSNLKEVVFVGGIAPEQIKYAFLNNSQLEKIIGKIDLSNIIEPSAYGWQLDAFKRCDNLKEVEFANNSIKMHLAFSSSSVLTTASIVSIINGLRESSSGQTLTLHADVKDKMTNDIMGTVELDETETYHIFTADPQGSVSLMDFATNTKGWTIA